MYIALKISLISIFTFSHDNLYNILNISASTNVISYFWRYLLLVDQTYICRENKPWKIKKSSIFRPFPEHSGGICQQKFQQLIIFYPMHIYQGLSNFFIRKNLKIILFRARLGLFMVLITLINRGYQLLQELMHAQYTYSKFR